MAIPSGELQNVIGSADTFPSLENRLTIPRTTPWLSTSPRLQICASLDGWRANVKLTHYRKSAVA